MGEKPTALRRLWEVSHRVLGTALLAYGFWQSREGIALYAIKYSVDEGDEARLAIAYWAWIGAMAAVIVFAGGFFRLRKVHHDEAAVVAPGKEVEMKDRAPVIAEILMEPVPPDESGDASGDDG